MSNYFVTTSIPYVNGDPHIGYAMELIQADVLARLARLEKKQVIFSIGTDEHGGKIAEKAIALKITPKELADKISLKFSDLADKLNISYDRFIRTTDADHIKRAQAIWQLLEKDIYKASYVGWYCTGDEAFFTETEVKTHNGICPNHNRPFEKIEEENYFFRLSKYGDVIKEAILNKTFNILPENKSHEILTLIDSGLDDISISRPKDKINWGIKIPNDNSQVMYVWFEALMNYITVLGYPDSEEYKSYWPAKVQVVGKDILRFHGAIWPAMLLSLGLQLPEKLYVHGFVTLNGLKIGKSLGNAISPDEIINIYGPDAFRYYFLRHIPSYGDGDFNWSLFEKAYNNELANELGNAVQRTITLFDKYFAEELISINIAQHDIAGYTQALSECRFDRALDVVWEQVRGLNQYIDETKPWEIAQSGDMDHLKEVLIYQASNLLEISILIGPFMPNTALNMKKIFNLSTKEKFRQILFPKLDKK